MKVITQNPIITASKGEVDNFLNASGATRRAKKATKKTTTKTAKGAKPKGQFVQKVKNFGKKVVDSGVLPIIAAQLGTAPDNSLPPIDVPDDKTDKGGTPNPPMTQSTKIIIGISVAVAVIGGIYLYQKNQGK